MPMRLPERNQPRRAVSCPSRHCHRLTDRQSCDALRPHDAPLTLSLWPHYRPHPARVPRPTPRTYFTCVLLLLSAAPSAAAAVVASASVLTEDPRLRPSLTVRARRTPLANLFERLETLLNVRPLTAS